MNAGYHIVEHIFQRIRACAGISTGNIPIVIIVAHIRHQLGQPRHDSGIELADAIGCAAGETEEFGIYTGLIQNDLLHSIKVS